MDKITLTVSEAASLIGVSDMTVYTMVKLKEIPHVRIRNKILFYRPIIERWLMDGGTIKETVRGEQDDPSRN